MNQGTEILLESIFQKSKLIIGDFDITDVVFIILSRVVTIE